MSSTEKLAGLSARIGAFMVRTTITPAEGAQGEFQTLALELFGAQYETNGFYRRLCDSRRVTPGSVKHWEEIPAVSTAGFRDFEVTSLEEAERRTIFVSSGTTGQGRSRHFHSEASLRLYEISVLSWFGAVWERVRQGWGLPAGKPRLMFLTPGPEEAPNSSLVHMFEAFRRELAAPGSRFMGKTDADGAWTVEPGAVRERLHAASETGEPVHVFGTAFSFVHLLDDGAARGIALPPGSMALETGGYKGRSRTLSRAELHREIRQHLGVSGVLSEYGMCELGSQGYCVRAAAGLEEQGDRLKAELRTALGFVLPPWARVSVVSPETGRAVSMGEAGLVRVYDLANVYSVMGVQTEDVGVLRGSGLELLGRAEMAEARGCSLLSAGVGGMADPA